MLSTLPNPRDAAVTAATSDLSASNEVSEIPCTLVVSEVWVLKFVSAVVAAAVIAAALAVASAVIAAPLAVASAVTALVAYS